MAETPQQSECRGSLIAGLLIGAAIGAALSLLYAPKSGRELRADIAGQLDELKDTVDHTARQVAQATKERLVEMKSDLTAAIESARATAAEHAAELSRRVERE